MILKYSERKLPKNCNLILLEKIINQKTKVLVRCKCGKEYKIAPQTLFRTNNVKCCSDCSSKNKIKGFGTGSLFLRQHPAYSVLDHIKQRCLNKKCKTYKWYGEKGITLCDEWKNDYKAFCIWAEQNGYKKGLSIDRIDPNKGYSPDNCRFVPMSKQRDNKHRQSNNTSGYTGVSFQKNNNKWFAYIWDNGRRINCGYWATKEQAYEARKKCLKELNLNYIRKEWI